MIALICSWLFTSYSLTVSRKVGRLSTITNYDDVSYLSKAADIYFTFRQDGVVPGVKLLFTKSLHSPFTDLDALLGYMVFGFNTDQVYYAQIVVLLSYLFFVGWFTRRLNGVFRASILLASLAVPFASLCVQVFRPDQMSGIIVAGLAVGILTSENLFDRKWKGVLLGLGLGLALLIKSTTFALILLVLAGAWFLTAMRMLLLRKSNIGAIAINGILALLTATVTASWYWMQHGSELWAYFIDNSFGKNADVWRTSGGIREHLLFYFQGGTLQSSLGLFVAPILLLFVGGCLSDLFQSRKPKLKMIAGGLLWMLVCIFGVYFLQGIKNQYMGGILYMFLFFGALVYAEALLLKCQTGLFAIPILGCCSALLLPLFSWSLYRYPSTEIVNPVWSANSKTTTLGLLSNLSEQIKSKPTPVLFTQAGPVVPEYVIMMLKSKSKEIVYENAALTRKLSDVIASLPRYDYVVLQDPEIEGRPGFPMPSEIWERDLKSYLDRGSEWSLLATYPTVDKKNVYLYERSNLITNPGL